jgi:hypothetical protein
MSFIFCGDDHCIICDRKEAQLQQIRDEAWFRAKYPNHGKRWTEEDLFSLANMRDAGVPMHIREQYFGRTGVAISEAIQRHLPRLDKTKKDSAT